MQASVVKWSDESLKMVLTFFLPSVFPSVLSLLPSLPRRPPPAGPDQRAGLRQQLRAPPVGLPVVVSNDNREVAAENADGAVKGRDGGGDQGRRVGLCRRRRRRR